MVVFRWVISGKSPTHKSDHFSCLEKLNYKYNKDTNNNLAVIKIFMVEHSLTQKIGLSVPRKRLLNFLGYMENI